MVSIISPVVRPALAAGEPGTAATTPIYPKRFDRIRPTSPFIAVLLIFLVLIGIEIAGERVYGFQQAVQSSERHALQIRFFDVFTLDPGQDFGVHGEMAVRVVGRGTLAQDCPADEEHQEGGTDDNQELPRLFMKATLSISGGGPESPGGCEK